MMAVTIQTDTGPPKNKQKAIDMFYRTIGILSEQDRLDILKRLETVTENEEKKEKSYHIFAKTSTGD